MHCSICERESFATHVHESCEPKDNKLCTREAVAARKNHQFYHSFPERPVVWTPDSQSICVQDNPEHPGGGSCCMICGERVRAGQRMVDICLRAFSPPLIKRAARRITRKA